MAVSSNKLMLPKPSPYLPLPLSSTDVSSNITGAYVVASSSSSLHDNENGHQDTSSVSEGFFLDPKIVNTQVIKRIGLSSKELNSIVVEVNEHLIFQSIHMDDYSTNTIQPLRRQLNEVLDVNDKRYKSSIINSVVTTINFNADKIKNLNSIKLEEQTRDNNEDVRSDAQVLVELASKIENVELIFKNQFGEHCAAVRNGDDKHLEILMLSGDKFRYYLARLFRQHHKNKVCSRDSITSAVNTLCADAEYDGEVIPLHLRVARGSKANIRTMPNCLYYDLTDKSHRIVEISANGWRIIYGSDPKVPLLFKRHNQISQVEPDREYNSDIFDRFINLTNIRNEDHKLLVKIYIVSLFIPDIVHPILTTYGPKGAAKSFLLGLIKKLVDPSRPTLLTLLKNIPEFIQQVNHNYLAFYDNVKYIPYWLSDEICKAVTGIGHTKRKLYSDDEDIVYEHKRCISLNGINVALTEPDALDRSIFIELIDIDEKERRKEEDLWSEFEVIKPKLLAYIFDNVSKAIKNKQNLHLSTLTRMADFEEWGEAISRALGYDEMDFVDAYRRNRNEQNIVAVSENIVGTLLVKFVEDASAKDNNQDTKFELSPDSLYQELVNFAEKANININTRQFPKTGDVLIKRLNLIRSNLKGGYGIVVDIERNASNRSIIRIQSLGLRNDNSQELT